MSGNKGPTVEPPLEATWKEMEVRFAHASCVLVRSADIALRCSAWWTWGSCAPSA
jgi:hypothetical protein